MGVVAPAAGHERVQGRRALLRFGQPVALFQLVNHITVVQPVERLFTSANNLPHADSWTGATREDRMEVRGKLHGRFDRLLCIF